MKISAKFSDGDTFDFELSDREGADLMFFVQHKDRYQHIMKNPERIPQGWDWLDLTSGLPMQDTEPPMDEILHRLQCAAVEEILDDEN